MLYGIQITAIDVGKYLVTCRDIPECTFTSSSELEALQDATKMLPGTIELFYRQKKRAIPFPSKIKNGEKPVLIPLRLQAKMLLWNTIVNKGLNLSTFAEAIGTSPSNVQRLVDFSKPASVDRIEEALANLGYLFDVSLVEETND